MSDNAYVKSSMTDQIQTIKILGRLTYDGINSYRDEVQKAIAEADGYIIDLSELEQIDSTGMGLMVNTARHFISNRQKMVLVVVDDMLYELFVISKLDLVFNILRDMPSALEAVSEDDETYWSKLVNY